MNDLNETESVANVLLDEDGIDEQITESSESGGVSREEIFDEEDPVFADSGKDSGRFATRTENSEPADTEPASDAAPEQTYNPDAHYEKFGAPSKKQLSEYQEWIRVQSVQIDQARQNNQIDNTQYRNALGELSHHAAIYERGHLAQEKAALAQQRYVSDVNARLTEIEPDLALPGKRQEIMNKSKNFLRDDLGISDEAINTIQHPELFKLVKFAMEAKQAKQSKQLKAMRQRKAKAAKAKAVRDAPTRDYNGSLSHSEKADAIADLLQKVGAV